VLAHYLKAVGVLRLIAEQADREARGFWRQEAFVLVTQLDENEVVDFFLRRYSPTALVAPWNQGSGFFTDDDPGVSPAERSTAARFSGLREGIRAARAALCDQQAEAVRAVRVIKD